MIHKYIETLCRSILYVEANLIVLIADAKCGGIFCHASGEIGAPSLAHCLFRRFTAY